MRKEWEGGEEAYKASQFIKNNRYRFLDIYTDNSKDENDKVEIGVYISSIRVRVRV